MIRPSNKVLGHTATAIGAGLTVTIGKVAETTSNPYVQAVCLGAVAALVTAGGFAAKRATP